jgi:hypothetical protein
LAGIVIASCPASSVMTPSGVVNSISRCRQYLAGGNQGSGAGVSNARHLNAIIVIRYHDFSRAQIAVAEVDVKSRHRRPPLGDKHNGSDD